METNREATRSKGIDFEEKTFVCFGVARKRARWDRKRKGKKMSEEIKRDKETEKESK